MVENFIVSARKYRPDNWDTVVGQKSITTTLQNAIATHQIAQAYLFCGPRGVGKTSCARIFARAVNTGFIEEGADLSFNVFELDAASNNSVEDIRQIVDTVRIPPQQGKYKIYIIDEVHMLSQAAFNAFLKTLEEPPAHAIFILATTEKHKILPTILSRCQIFDFNRIKVRDIAEHLAGIAGRENINAEADALHVIAQKADGAMRDALSIFDQVVAFCGRDLRYQDVIANLNVLDYDYYFRLTDLVMKEDIPGTLLIFDEIINKGFDGHHFITGFGSHLRNLLVCKDPQTIQLLEVSDNVASKYAEQGAAIDLRMVIEALEFINECDVQYRGSKHQRLLVELTLIQICSIPYNKREGEKKKFKLMPFRSDVAGVRPAATAAPQLPKAPPAQVIPATPKSETALGRPSLPVTPAEPAKPRKMSGVTMDIPSLKKLTSVQVKQESDDTAVKVVEEVATREYSIDEIQMAWLNFTAKFSRNMQVQTALKVAVIELTEPTVLRVAFPSETQQMYFNDVRAELAEFFKANYDIVGLKFVVDVQRQNEIKLSTRTDKEKFDAMKEKNPALEQLWRNFQLRID